MRRELRAWIAIVLIDWAQRVSADTVVEFVEACHALTRDE